MPTDKPKGTTDLDLLAEMFADVQRLGEPPRRPSRPSPPPPAATRAPAPPPAAAPAPPAPPAVDERDLLRAAFEGVRPLGKASPARPVPRAGPAPVAAGRPAAPAAGLAGGGLSAPSAELLAHLQKLNGSLEAELVGHRQAATAAAEQIAALRAELATATRELGEARKAREAVAAELDLARRELVRAADRDRERLRRIEAIEGTPAPVAAGPTRDLRSLLEARGLRGEDEMGAALAALAGARRLGPLLTQFSTAHPDTFADFLVERLALTAPGESPDAGRVAVEVEANRSDLLATGAVNRAIAAFSEACLLAGKRRVLIVGGSPSYRKALQAGMDARIQLTLVEGNRRNFRTQGTPDLTIVWGATELDHATSIHFPDAIVVNHRGITGMLERVLERLRG